MQTVELMSEPVAVHDVYVSGLGHIEELEEGGDMRFTFYVRRASPHGGTEYTVEARLIMSRQAVWEAVKATLLRLGIRCVGGACPQALKRLVH